MAQEYLLQISIAKLAGFGNTALKDSDRSVSPGLLSRNVNFIPSESASRKDKCPKTPVFAPKGTLKLIADGYIRTVTMNYSAISGLDPRLFQPVLNLSGNIR